MANKNKTSPTSTTKAVAALSTMLAFSVCPTQAFQPSFLASTARLTDRNAWSPSVIRPAPVTMYTAPWDTHGDVPQRQPHGQHRRPAAVVFSPPDWYQGASIQGQHQLQLSDPAVVQDTDDIYALSFILPPEVDHDGLQVSVSGRLLTVKAHITREEGFGPSRSRGGWITRSSQTESVSRSFVLPEGVLPSSASTSFGADGKVEVKLNKDKAAAVQTTSTATITPTAPSTNDAAASGSAERPTATTATPASPAAAAGSSPEKSSVANAAAMTADSPAAVADDGEPSRPSATDAAQAGDSERAPSHPESAFEALDKEFRDFAEAMWGDFLLPRLQLPTQAEREKQAAEAREWRAKREAELAMRAKAAKEARERRVTAMRRATMAADISQAEDRSSYVVKVALPEGITRDQVKLVVDPGRFLRVTASAAAADGASGRSVFKDVLLPEDAILSDVSAKFEDEQQHKYHDTNMEGGVDDAKVATADAGTPGTVSGLEITVGRVIPLRPKSIDIV